MNVNEVDQRPVSKLFKAKSGHCFSTLCESYTYAVVVGDVTCVFINQRNASCIARHAYELPSTFIEVPQSETPLLDIGNGMARMHGFLFKAKDGLLEHCGRAAIRIRMPSYDQDFQRYQRFAMSLSGRVDREAFANYRRALSAIGISTEYIDVLL